MPLRTANIIGSGPNGLAAAITLAQRGVAVTVYERNARIGGACSTDEVTLPGFRHDLGSSVYPLGVASPFFRSSAAGSTSACAGSSPTLRSRIRWTTERPCCWSTRSKPPPRSSSPTTRARGGCCFGLQRARLAQRW